MTDTLKGCYVTLFKRLFTIARAEVNARLHSTDKAGRKWTRTESASGQASNDQAEDSSTANGHAHHNREGQKPHNTIEEWYEALEIPYGSDLDQAQKAWKKLLRQYHPDMHSSDEEKARIAHQVTLQLNEAYNGLKEHLSKK